MVKIKVNYLGDLHCEAIHEPSGKSILTDAPKDNGGKGETFSPTDLLATSLATCIATTMGLYAQRKGLDLEGMQLEVEKLMKDQPYRYIGCLKVTVKIPDHFSETERSALERVAHQCPVHKSLHPDVSVEINFK